MLLAELGMRVFFYIAKALNFQNGIKASQKGDACYNSESNQ